MKFMALRSRSISALAAILPICGASLASAEGGDVNRDMLTVVEVDAEDGNGVPIYSQGTGFFVGNSGNILTSYHLIGGLPSPPRPGTLKITVRIGAKAAQPIDAEIVDKNTERDILLLSIDTKMMGRPACVDPNYVATEGASIFSAGFPSSLPFAQPHGSIISTVGPHGTWIVDAAINEGQSGSPIFDRKGNVIGIAKGQVKDSQQNAVPGQYMVVPIIDAPRISALAKAGCEDPEVSQWKIFSENVHLGAPRHLVETALGTPNITTPAKALAQAIQLTEDFSFTTSSGGKLTLSKQEIANVKQGIADANIEATAYRSSTFVAEIVYFDDVVAQFSVLLTKPRPISIDDLRDRPYWIGYKAMPSSLGELYFSEVGCPFVGGASDYPWVKMACRADEVTNGVAVDLFWSRLGADLTGFANQYLAVREGDPLIDKFEMGVATGIILLSDLAQWNAYRDGPKQCGKYGSPPIDTEPELDQALAELAPLAQSYAEPTQAQFCFSTRILQPNGIVIKEDNASIQIEIGDGRKVLIYSEMISDGMLIGAYTGARRKSLFPSTVSVFEQ